MSILKKYCIEHYYINNSLSELDKEMLKEIKNSEHYRSYKAKNSLLNFNPFKVLEQLYIKYLNL